ncbi:hypothetical protein ACWKX9_26050 [Enterobacter asburiae]
MPDIAGIVGRTQHGLTDVLLKKAAFAAFFMNKDKGNALADWSFLFYLHELLK